MIIPVLSSRSSHFVPEPVTLVGFKFARGQILDQKFCPFSIIAVQSASYNAHITALIRSAALIKHAVARSQVEGCNCK